MAIHCPTDKTLLVTIVKGLPLCRPTSWAPVSCRAPWLRPNWRVMCARMPSALFSILYARALPLQCSSVFSLSHSLICLHIHRTDRHWPCWCSVGGNSREDDLLVAVPLSVQSLARVTIELYALPFPLAPPGKEARTILYRCVACMHAPFRSEPLASRAAEDHFFVLHQLTKSSLQCVSSRIFTFHQSITT